MTHQHKGNKTISFTDAYLLLREFAFKSRPINHWTIYICMPDPFQLALANPYLDLAPVHRHLTHRPLTNTLQDFQINRYSFTANWLITSKFCKCAEVLCFITNIPNTTGRSDNSSMLLNAIKMEFPVRDFSPDHISGEARESNYKAIS